MFLAALFTRAKTWKQPKGPSTDEKDVIYKYNGRILSHKKEWKNAIFSNTDGRRDCLSKSKTNPIVCCSWVQSNFLKWHKWTYLQNRKRLAQFETDLWLPKENFVGRDTLEAWDEHTHTTNIENR